MFRKKVRGGRSVPEVEDILLSERGGKGQGKGNGHASYGKKSEREQGREII